MGLFNLFKKKEEEEPVVTVEDPEIDKLREEKFNIPVIEDEDETKKVTPKNNNLHAGLPDYSSINRKSVPSDEPYSVYRFSEIISPMSGRTEKKKEEEPVKPKPTKRKTAYTEKDELYPNISPMYGNQIVPKRKEKKVEPVPVKKEIVPEVTKKEEVVKADPKPVNKIDAAIVEQSTGELTFDLPEEPIKNDALINEIGDEMTLDELLTLYEKKK